MRDGDTRRKRSSGRGLERCTRAHHLRSMSQKKHREANEAGLLLAASQRLYTCTAPPRLTSATATPTNSFIIHGPNAVACRPRPRRRRAGERPRPAGRSRQEPAAGAAAAFFVEPDGGEAPPRGHRLPAGRREACGRDGLLGHPGLRALRRPGGLASRVALELAQSAH